MRLIISVALLSATLICHSQTTVIDSLKQLLEKKNQDTSRVLLLNILAITYQHSKLDTSLLLAQEALILARRINFSRGEGNSLTIIGNVFYGTGNYPKALYEHLEALKIREKINDLRGMGVSFANIGNIYSEQGDEVNALKYILKGKVIAEAIRNDELLANALVNAGDSYEKLNRLDSALNFTQQGYILAVHEDDKDLAGIALNNLANIYNKMGQPVLAMKYYRLSLPLYKEVNDDENFCESTLGMAALFNNAGNADSALHYARLSLSTAKDGGFPKRVLNAAKFLSGYFRSHQSIDSAYAYQELSIAIKDSIFSKEKSNEVQNLIFTEQIRQQELAEANRKAMIERNHGIQIIGIASFIPFFFGLVLILSKRKANKHVVEFSGLLGLLLLFEFISLLIDPHIGKWTHHTPVYLLAINICIASVLLSLHHKMVNWFKEKLVPKRAPSLKPIESVVNTENENKPDLSSYPNN